MPAESYFRPFTADMVNAQKTLAALPAKSRMQDVDIRAEAVGSNGRLCGAMQRPCNYALALQEMDFLVLKDPVLLLRDDDPRELAGHLV